MNSQLDDVNALMKIPGLDKFRLKHIKETLEKGKMLYISDSKYLNEQTKEHLENYEGEKLSKYDSYDWPEHSDKQKNTSFPETKAKSESVEESEAKKIETEEKLFCGNCGNGIKNENFCPKCGYAIVSDKETKLEVKNKTKSKENIPEEKIVYQKDKGIGIKKKLLIGLGIVFIIFIVGGELLPNSNDTSDTTIIVGDSIHLGSIIVELEKIEFHRTYATVFLSVENLGPDEGHIYETGAYAIQGKSQFQPISKPSGASGKWIDGYNIPAQTIREGVIFLDIWNPNEPYELVLDGSYIEQDQFGGLIKDVKFVFSIESITLSNSKCGPGTVFDEASNTCILG